MVFGVIVFVVSLLCNLVWFLSHFAIFLIHYFFVLLILLCIVSKFMKLKRIDIESLLKVFSPHSFPVSYLGSVFDAPENTKASFEYVSEMSSILLIFCPYQNIPSELFEFLSENLLQPRLNR